MGSLIPALAGKKRKSVPARQPVRDQSDQDARGHIHIVQGKKCPVEQAYKLSLAMKNPRGRAGRGFTEAGGYAVDELTKTRMREKNYQKRPNPQLAMTTTRKDRKKKSSPSTQEANATPCLSSRGGGRKKMALG